MIDLLPLELILLVSEYLDLRSKISLMNSCSLTRFLLYPEIKKISETVPIRITVDFSRDNDHHIHVHNVWIKIGWFTPKLALTTTYEIGDILEYCTECLTHRLFPCDNTRGIYVLVKKIYDMDTLIKILASKKNPCFNFHRMYFPRIGELSCTGIECPQDHIHIGQLVPLTNPNAKIKFGVDRSLVLHYGYHKLYRNMVGYQPLV